MANTSSRRRSRDDDSDEDGVEVGRRESFKRVKVERAERRQVSPEGDEEDERMSDAQPEGEESSEDEYDSEDEEARIKRSEFPDDSANVAALERFRARKAAREGMFGKMSEAGVVKSITVKNFMNHQHHTIEFSPQLNFLVGHNGSGKSAILTALTVALGGKAASTGRGNGLKDLIRKGCDKATITVTMTNSGSEAYKPDIYSPHIVIERIISATGGSQYKFRAERDGKILATKREELNQMMEHFNIVVDSPLTVLTQDAARTFLQSAQPQALYKFFLEGTGLKGLSDQYIKVDANKATLDGYIKQSDADLASLAEKTHAAQRSAEASEKYAELVATHHALKMELPWTYVVQKKKECAAAEVAVREAEEKAEDIAAHVLRVEEEERPYSEQIAALEVDLEEFDKTRRPVEMSKAKAAKKLKQARDELANQTGMIKETDEEIRRRQKEAATWQAKIEAKQAESTDAEDPKQAKIRSDIEKLEVVLAKMVRELPIKQELVKQREDELIPAEKEVDSMTQQRDRQAALESQARSKLNSLQSQTTDRTSAFGRGLQKVWSEMDKVTWRHRPIGPIGMHVQLVDLAYREIISSSLGQILCGFIVLDKQDKAHMMRILRYCVESNQYLPGTGKKTPPMVIQWGGDRFDYSSGDLSRFGETVLSKLKVDNEDVLRVLITQAQVEKRFVAPTLEKAQRDVNELIAKGVNNPVVLTHHFAASGNQDSLSTNTTQDWTGNVLFTKDVASEITAQQKVVEEAKALGDKIKKALIEANTALRNATDRAAEARRSVAHVRQGQAKARSQIDRLKDQLEVGERVNVMDSYISAKRAVEISIAELEATQEVNTNGLGDYKDSILKFEAEITDLDDQLESFAPMKLKKQNALATLLATRSKVQRHLAHYKSAAQKHAPYLVRREEELAAKRTEVETWTASALSMSPEIETTRSIEEVKAHVATAAQAIANGKKNGHAAHDELLAKYRQLSEQLRTYSDKVKAFTKYSEMLSRAVLARQRWWMEMRGHTATRARAMFIVHLQTRGFEGKLDFIHTNETLNLRVIPRPINREDGDETAPTQVFNVPKNLSGGERSFSTVAFLLSLWDVAVSPVRCLDEWDVFLDSVNRGIAAKMLIEGALASVGRQYILITPQDMSGIKLDGAGLKVHRMKDPERGQTTLSFAG